MLEMLVTAALSLAVAPPDLIGEHSTCSGGRRHTIRYNASTAGNSFIDLDGDLGKDLKHIDCDLDSTRILLTFKNYAKKLYWAAKFDSFANHFLVGGTKWCKSKSGRPATIMRKVVLNPIGPHDFDDSFQVSTAEAKYSEMFKDASIEYGSRADTLCAQVNADLPICLGYNADCQSGSAKGPLPIYQSAQGSFVDVQASCSDCWAALEGDVFALIVIQGFKLQSLGAGLKDMALQASAVLDASAAKMANLNVDKTYHLVQSDSPLVEFKVGAVPFVLSYEIPMEISAEVDFNAHAELTFGVGAKIGFGDLDITWDPTNHWHVGKPKLSHTFTPSLSTSAALDVNSQVTLKPSFALHFDGIFTQTISANPTLTGHITASEASKQACMESTFSMDVDISAELKIDIAFLNIHKDWQFDPQPIVKWTGEPIPHTCVPL
jgi:hypothetical protein